jgi:hypothetical protein
LRAEDRRSLALTRAALARLCQSWPSGVAQVRANIATMRRAGSCSPTYLRRWEALLAAGPRALADALLADTDEAQVLRSVHPLAGLLSPCERWAVLDQVRE